MDLRPKRHSQIIALLRSQRVESQEHLQELLSERGLRVAQATLSRDLRSLGVMKGPAGYVLAQDFAVAPANPESDVAAISDNPSLTRALAMFVLRVDAGGNLVVLRTGPGHAQVVALEFDRRPPDEVMGTIAGDDTVFIAVRSERRAAALARELRAAVVGAGDRSRAEASA